eukprot:TRINITY_DN7838_c0_g10_i1.p1 TRINITY_DN7838_c0_g10~~TRINITY_DN7838_c0_g10_i1.p1  ORF type:complete len:214 (+),score=18.18 TRINITY_DN7838_c0_g10_i1:114-755(+)
MNKKLHVATIRPLKLRPAHCKDNLSTNKPLLESQLKEILEKRSKCKSPEAVRKRRSVYSYSPLYHIKNSPTIRRNYTIGNAENELKSSLRFNEQQDLSPTTHDAYDQPTRNILTNEIIFERTRAESHPSDRERKSRNRTLSSPCTKKQMFNYKQLDPIKLETNVIVTELMLDKFNSARKRKRGPRRRVVYPAKRLTSASQIKPLILKLLKIRL